MKCKNCGYNDTSEAARCPRCNAKLEELEAEQEATTPALPEIAKGQALEVEAAPPPTQSAIAENGE